MEKKVSELEIGERFKYNHREFTKLDEHLAIMDYIDCNFGYCQWCASVCDCDYEHSFVRKYLNNNYISLAKFNKEELNADESGDYLRLMTAGEFEKYKKYISIWKNDIVWTQSIKKDSMNNETIIGYRFTIPSGYSEIKASKHEGLKLRPLINIKDDIVVISLGKPERNYFKCSLCGNDIVSFDDDGLPTAKLIDNQPVCDECEIDALMPKIKDYKIKNIIMKQAVKKFVDWCNVSFCRPAPDINGYIKQAYNEYLAKHKGEF